MSGELPPGPSPVRISDAERAAITERLSRAAGEGRLTLDEFEQRMAGVLAARTFADVEPYLADLPGRAARPAAPELGEIRAIAAGLKRNGRWVVARWLKIKAKAGSVKLDFTDAVIAHPIVEIELETFASSTTLVLPPGATVDVELLAGNARVLGVPVAMSAGQERHFVVRGTQKAGGLVVRYQREFWGWRW